MELAPSTTAEDWVVAVTKIVRLYRRTSPNPHAPEISFEDAVSRLRALGLEDGDATRWLSPRRRAARAFRRGAAASLRADRARA
jgi:hypothetical protein